MWTCWGPNTYIASFDSVVRRRYDDWISRSKHVASCTINNKKNSCAWRVSYLKVFPEILNLEICKSSQGYSYSTTALDTKTWHTHLRVPMNWHPCHWKWFLKSVQERLQWSFATGRHYFALVRISSLTINNPCCWYSSYITCDENFTFICFALPW